MSTNPTAREEIVAIAAEIEAADNAGRLVDGDRGWPDRLRTLAPKVVWRPSADEITASADRLAARHTLTLPQAVAFRDHFRDELRSLLAPQPEPKGG